MSQSPFDAPSLNRADGDGRYVTFTADQTLTEDQKTQVRTNLGIDGAAGVGVDVDPDGTTVLIVGSDTSNLGYDGGVDF